jgi:invasion protein IalB
MQQTSKSPLFPLGQLVATPGALAALEKSGQRPQDFLSRHVHGDWGDLCDEDRNENQRSLHQGLRLLSSYRTLADVKLYVITEADRAVTAILLPEEY